MSAAFWLGALADCPQSPSGHLSPAALRWRAGATARGLAGFEFFGGFFDAVGPGFAADGLGAEALGPEGEGERGEGGGSDDHEALRGGTAEGGDEAIELELLIHHFALGLGEQKVGGVEIAKDVEE